MLFFIIGIGCIAESIRLYTHSNFGASIFPFIIGSLMSILSIKSGIKCVDIKSLIFYIKIFLIIMITLIIGKYISLAIMILLILLWFNLIIPKRNHNLLFISIVLYSVIILISYSTNIHIKP